ncbi:MAG: hypothetical protein V1834_00705, partial [Candidatus Micrarchaeota archaeon]
SAVDLLASGSVTVSIKCVSSSCSGTPTVTPSVPTVRPTQPAVSPTPPPEEDAAYLAVTVLDSNSESVDAIVYVYNAFSDLLISTIEADDGNGVLGTELTAGTRLYFTAEADGYAPFDGTQEPAFEVEEGWNAYTIRMQLLNESSNYTQSTITVLDENATGLPDARVAVYELGNSIPRWRNKLTREDGSLTVDLLKGKQYQASGEHAGYLTGYSDVFNAGNSVNVSLVKVTEENTASLNAKVVWVEDESVASGADVGVFQKTSGMNFPLGQGRTNLDGVFTFFNLPRSQVVLVKASKDARFGEASMMLVNAENNLTVALGFGFANATVSAKNIRTGNPVPGVSFKAFYGGQELDSCTSNGCVLDFYADVPVMIKATAPGYRDGVREVNADIRDELNVSFEMVATADLDDSELVFVGLFTQAGVEAEYLHPGSVYEAHFQLLTESADYSGAFFSLSNSNAAWISGFAPRAAFELGSTSGCSPKEVGEDVKLNSLELKFFDGGGDGDYYLKFNITVNPAVVLDQATNQLKLDLNYSSFVERGNSVLRNPYDDGLAMGKRPDGEYQAGCSARRYGVPLTISSQGVSCNEFGCMALQLAQGGEGPVDYGLNAVLSKGFDDAGNLLSDPLKVFYTVKLFQPLTQDDSQLSFTLDSGIFSGSSVSLPFSSNGYSYPVPGSEWDRACGFKGKQNPGFSAYSVSLNGESDAELDLSPLTSCLAYSPPSIEKPLSFFGALSGSVSKETTEKSVVESGFYSGTQSVAHDSWFTVSEGPVSVTQWAAVSVNMQQAQGTKTVKVTDSELKERFESGEPGFTVLTQCIDEGGESVACGDLNVNVVINVRQGSAGQQPSLVLNYDKTVLNAKQVLYRLVKPGEDAPNYAPLSLSSFSSSNGLSGKLPDAVSKNDKIEIVVLFDSVQDGWSNPFELVFKNGGDTSFETSVLVYSESSFQPPSPEPLGPTDDCGGVVILAYTPQYGLTSSCTALTLFASPVFPADAVPLVINSEGASISPKTGYSPCFKIDTNTGWLKYNADDCPDAYRLLGNELPGLQQTITFGVLGADPDDPMNSVDLEVTVQPLTFDLQLFSKVADVGPVNPPSQIWRVANLNQLSGVRGFSLGVSYPELSFNGPGVRVFDLVKSGSFVASERAGDDFLELNALDLNSVSSARTVTAQNSFQTFKEIIQKAENLAKQTVFRRSFDQTLWCQRCPAGAQGCVEDTDGVSWECRSSKGAWKKYDYTEYSLPESCSKPCLDFTDFASTYAGDSQDICAERGKPNGWTYDSRCVQSGNSQYGTADLTYAEYTEDETPPKAFVCGLVNGETQYLECVTQMDEGYAGVDCIYDCDSWAGEPNCEIGCECSDPSNPFTCFRDVPVQQLEEVWDTVTGDDAGLVEKTMSGAVSPEARQHYGNGVYPFDSFEHGSEPFVYYDVIYIPRAFAGTNASTVNTFLTNLGVNYQPILNEETCGDFQGYFLFEASSSNGVSWHYSLAPLILESKSQQSALNKCTKAAEASKFSEQPLCGLVYSDNSMDYGQCVNSFNVVFDDDSVSGIEDRFSNANLKFLFEPQQPDLREGSFIGFGSLGPSMSLVNWFPPFNKPGNYIIANPEGMIVSYDGFYLAEDDGKTGGFLGTGLWSKTKKIQRHHFLFWNPLGEAVNVVPLICDCKCSDFSGWGRTPDNEPGFKTCITPFNPQHSWFTSFCFNGFKAKNVDSSANGC